MDNARAIAECEALTFASHFFGAVKTVTPVLFSLAGEKTASCLAAPPLPIIEASASVSIGDCNASVAIKTTADWRTVPPRVYCHADWMRANNQDWHTYDDGHLCFAHEKEWRDSVVTIEETVGPQQTVEFAARLCAQNGLSLIERHYQGSRLCLVRWPSEWEALSHGEKGTLEYERSKAQCLSELRAALMAELSLCRRTAQATEPR